MTTVVTPVSNTPTRRYWNQRTIFIYTLANPQTGVIRYVGKTKNIKQRLYEHCSKHDASVRSKWIRSLQAKGLEPLLEVLDEVPVAEWEQWEMYWIEQLKSWGHTLYNADGGGSGMRRTSPEVKKKIRAALLGRRVAKVSVQYNQYSLEGALIASFPSPKAAALAVIGRDINLSSVVHKGRTGYGFLWTKGSNPPQQIQPYIAKRPSPPVSREPWQKPVVQRTAGGQLIKMWPSQKEAAEGVGIAASGIRKVLRGQRKLYGGFLWTAT